MGHKDTTRYLFSIINGCLSYEYNVKLLEYHGKNNGILIVKEDSDHIMQIVPNEHDNTCAVLVWVDGNDSNKDIEVYQWDLNSPDLTLDDILTDIKNRL